MMISGCDVLIRLLALDAAGSAEAAEDVPMAWTRIDGCAVRLIAEFRVNAGAFSMLLGD